TVMTSEEADIILQEMRNGSRSRVYGSNIELSVAPSNMLSIQAGGTIQRSRYSEEQVIFEGEDPADDIVTTRYMRTPNTYGYLNTNIKATKQLAVDLTGVYTGSMLVPHYQPDRSEERRVGKECKCHELVNKQNKYDKEGDRVEVRRAR